jgi:predicted O-methyltransferase YrrM
MSQELWTRIDNYFNDHLAPPDPILDAALSSAADADLPPIDVAPNQGALLHILALAQGTKIILEIGTLAGYSTICLARALPPDGQLITLEYEPKHAQVAAANIANAGLTDRVDIRVGKAIDTLPKLAQENPDPFDLIFIDADKASNPDYFNWAMKLSKIGTLIIIDNVVREGEVLNPDSEDPDIQGIRKLIKQLKAEPRITTTVIQTVGTKGHDGLALARVIK